MAYRKPFHIFLLCCCCSVSFFKAYAQSIKTTCKVVDKDDKPIPFAALQIASATDSVNIHYEETADSNGIAVFTLTQGSKYIVKMFAVNYKPVRKNIVIKGEKPVFIIKFETDTKTLKDVEITYKRPLLRQEDDKTIVDPEELAATSTSAYDIMEKIPGLFVDQDGNIYITSTTPATIYINGREQKMSNQDVAAMLKSLPPNSIEKIEILRTPSTKYDASTSGGIVNVVLKKGVHIGLTGSVNAGLNQGTYGNQFAGLTINNNNGLFNTSITLQVNHRVTGERLKTNRMFAPDSLSSQDAYTKYPGLTYFSSYSIGYTPNTKWDFTYDGRISLNNTSSNSNSPTTIEQISTGTNAATYNTALDNNSNNINLSQGLSVKYKPDTLGSEWSADFSYNYVPVNSTQSYTTSYFFPVSAVVAGDGDVHSHLQFLSFQSDITKKLPFKSTLESGIKMTGVWFDNKTDYTINHNGITSNDAQRTNAYNYDEHIYAAYLQASRNFGKVLIKAGTRLENTNMNGNQLVPSDTSFKLTRTDLFPYLYISRKVMSIAGFELRAYLIYRRTITRPTYEYLNPFHRYVDQYLSEVGNPSLKPQFTKNYEANISVDERPIFAIGYNDMSDIFSQVIYQADSSHRQAYRTYDNLGSNKEIYFRGLAAIPPGKTYFFVIGVQYNHNFYQGQYDGAPLSYKHGSWTLFTYQTLKLSKLTQVVLNGFVRFNGQIQFYELSNFGSLNLSINHQFFHKKLKITASITDMFLTNNNEFSINEGNVHATGLRKGDTRRFGLNVSYNFGIHKKEEQNFMNQESPEKIDK